MIDIKKLIGLIMALTFVLTAVSLSTQAVVIDGYDKNDEWSGATVIGFSENNNGVDLGVLSCIIGDRFNAYFRLQLFDAELTDNNTESGFVLYIGGEKVLEAVGGECITVNNSRYSTEAKCSAVSQQEIMCEVKLGIKNGIGEKLVGTICFVDADGIGSNVYPFEIDNAQETVPVQTTREITTREPTARRTTTRRETTRRTTTRRATTTRRPATTKRTTAKPQTTHNYSYPDVTARYETAAVYVNGATEPTTTVPDTTQVESAASQQTTIALVYYATSPAEAYNKGKRMKIAVCAASGVAFILLAAWGGAKMGKNDKKPEENSNEKSDKD